MGNDDLVLNPDDPFDAALIPMVLTNRKKRSDYATTDDVFSNFIMTADFAGFEEPWLSALFNCQQKLARIKALRANGKLDDPTNEAVEDTLLDNAVYAVIALAIYRSRMTRHTLARSGMCGVARPDLDVSNPMILCELPAGHLGWHSDQEGTTWRTPTEPQY